MITLNETQHRHDGFSAVELLISLVVASIFLFAGFAFYNSITRYSVEARNRANADRIAYDYLRRYENNVGATCAANPNLLATTAVTNNPNAGGMLNPTIRVSVTCPLSTTIPSLSKLTARVQYTERSQLKTVEQEVYATP